MWMKIIKKISQLSVGQLKVYRVTQTLFYLSALLFFVVRVVMNPHQPMNFLFIILVIGFQISLSNLFLLSLNNILVQDLNISKYQSVIENCHDVKMVPFYPSKKAIQSDYLLNIALVYFYKGEFLETLESLGKIESLHHFNKGVRDLYSSAYYQLYFLSKLFRQEEYDIDAIVANMRLLKPRSKKQQAIINQRLSIIQSLHEVVKDRKSSDFLETLAPHNELEKLVYSYYQALNAQVLGNDEKVQEHFLLLSKLNDDFYYVREAKKYLEEKKYVR